MIGIALCRQNKIVTTKNSFLEEIRQLNISLMKLESELAVSKQANSLFSEKDVDMERQCWSNAKYLRNECLEVSGIHCCVFDENLESKAFENI